MTAINHELLNLSAGIAAIALALPPAFSQCAATPSQTEGPYYRTPNPETNNLRIGSDGPAFTFHGRVTDTACNPLPYAWVAIWHADPAGVYDNTAPYDRYRGYFFTDANGEFTLNSILPGLYPGRTRHTHIKIDTPNSAVLTTQFYFPGEPLNQSDGLYNPALEIEMTQQPDGSYVGSYDFVLAVSGACTAPTVTVDPAPVTLNAGGNATVSISATGGVPMTYRWSRNGTPLENGARFSGVTTPSLTVTGATCADSGAYTCSALNTCGSDMSAAAVLTVNGCCTGDLNADNAIDLADLAVLLAHFGNSGAGSGDGDLDADSDVDLSDLATLLARFGTTC